MKKFSKILLLLLAVVALMTAFVVVTAAADEVAADSYSKPVTGDWEGKEDGAFIGVATTRYGYMYAKIADDGNYYGVWEPRDGNPNNFVEPGLVTTMTGDKIFKYNMKDYPYMMFDFDVMTPTGAYNDASINFRFQHTTARDGKSSYVGFPVTFSVNSFSGYVSKTPFEWKHVSVVMAFDWKVDGETNKTTEVKVTYYYYVNGELANVVEPTGAGAMKGYIPEDIGWTAVRVNGTSGSDTTQQTAFDNFNISYFNGAFGSSDETKISEMVATVYNDDYVLPFGKTVANIGNVAYDDINEAIDAAEEGQTIVLADNISGTVTVDKAISIDRNVYDEDSVATGEFFDIAYSSNTLVPFEENGIVTFMKLQNSSVQVYWDDCPGMADPEIGECTCPEGMNDHLMSAVTESAMLNTIPVYPGEVPTFEIVDGKMKKFVGWSYTQGGEAEELRAITSEDCAEGWVSLYPVYEIFEYDIELTLPDGTAKYFTEAEYSEAFVQAKSGSTIKLLDDVTTTANVAISTNLTVDLNGKTLKRWNVSAVKYKAVDNGDGTFTLKNNGVLSYGSKPAVFTVNGAVTFTLTSSQPGAQIFNGSLMKNNEYYDPNNTSVLVGTVANGSIMGGQLISTSGAASDSVTNINGANLSFYGSEILCADNGANNNVTFNVDGGYYHRIVADFSGIIDNRVGATMNFKNATFYTDSSSTILYQWATKSNSHGAVTFENCDLIGGGIYNNDSAVVTFNNCRISSTGFSLGATGAAFVVGKDCVLTNGLGTAAKLAEDVKIVEAGAAKSYVISDIEFFRLNADKSDVDPSSYEFGTKTINVTFKYSVVDVNATLATIKWVDAEGNLLGESQALKNSVVTPIKTAAIPSGDGYRKMVVQQWLNADGVVDYAIGDADEYVFTAIAPTENIEYVAGITDIRLSLTYYNGFHMNVYLPYVEGMEIPTMINASGTDIVHSKSTVLIDGVKYWCLTSYSATTYIFNDIAATVGFTIDEVSYSAKYVIGGLVYAEIVLNDANATELEKASVGNMVRFVRESLQAYESSNQSIYARIDKLIGSEDGSVKGVYEIADYIANDQYPDINKDFSAIEKYVESVHFKMAGTYAAYVFTKTDEAVAAGVTLSVTTANGAWGLRDNAAAGKTPWTLNLRVYDAIDTFTINVHIPAAEEGGEATTVSAEYSIGSYINATDSELAKALYAFGCAAKEYRNNRTDY